MVNRRGKTPRDVCRSPGIVALIEAAARGQLQDLGTSSGDELTPQQKGGYPGEGEGEARGRVNGLC